MPDTTVTGIDDSVQKMSASHSKHIGMLNGESVALYIGEASDPVIVQFSRDITLGRFAPGTVLKPTVDLTGYGGYEKGISRLHAAIRRHPQGGLMVEDMGSANGTWLNGDRLQPYAPQRLKSGDRLTLARLPIAVYLSSALASSAPAEPEKRSEVERPLTPTGSIPVEMLSKDTMPVGEPYLIEAPKPSKLSQYQADIELSAPELSTDAALVAAKIVDEFLKLNGCEIKLTLHIEARSPSGFDESTVRAIQAASAALRMQGAGFKPE